MSVRSYFLPYAILWIYLSCVICKAVKPQPSLLVSAFAWRYVQAEIMILSGSTRLIIKKTDPTASQPCRYDETKFSDVEQVNFVQWFK